MRAPFVAFSLLSIAERSARWPSVGFATTLLAFFCLAGCGSGASEEDHSGDATASTDAGPCDAKTLEVTFEGASAPERFDKKSASRVADTITIVGSTPDGLRLTLRVPATSGVARCDGTNVRLDVEVGGATFQSADCEVSVEMLANERVRGTLRGSAKSGSDTRTVTHGGFDLPLVRCK